MSAAFEQTTIGEIVASDSRAAGIFEQFGIDFCCGGHRSVAEACRAAAVDPVEIRHALEALSTADESGGDDVEQWRVDQLIDRIVNTHHAYIRSALPVIRRHLAKLVEVHGARHFELARVAASFDRVARDLLHHMIKEEQVLFPYILELASAGHAPLSSPFGTVENPIRVMEREHRQAGDEMRQIRAMTNGYAPPSDACTTYRVAFEELARFERDLHRHVHLENSVLFPKAVELERGEYRA